MGAGVVIFFFLPWLDRGAVKSIRYRGALYKTWLAIFVFCFLVLGYLGTVSVTVWGQFSGGWSEVLDTKDRATWLARLVDAGVFPVLCADALVYRSRQDQTRAGESEMVRVLRCVAGVILLALAGAALAARSRACFRRRRTASMSNRCSAARATSSTTA